MPFHHHQGAPEVALTYRRREGATDRVRVTAMYQYYDVVDRTPAAAGNNNYAAHQMLVEAYWVF